jgi:hypothetical protein
MYVSYQDQLAVLNIVAVGHSFVIRIVDSNVLFGQGVSVHVKGDIKIEVIWAIILEIVYCNTYQVIVPVKAFALEFCAQHKALVGDLFRRTVA